MISTGFGGGLLGNSSYLNQPTSWQWMTPPAERDRDGPPISIDAANDWYLNPAAQPQQRYYPKAIAQQPPSYTMPVPFPARTWQAGVNHRLQVWQTQTQYPAVQGPVYVPAPVVVSTMGWDAPSVQVFPCRVAQQPPALTQPVFVPEVIIAYQRAWDAQSPERPRLRLIPQQPPSRAGPDFVPLDTRFDQQMPPTRAPVRAQQPPSYTEPPQQPSVSQTLAWLADSVQMRAPRRAQQPPSLTQPVFVEYPPETFVEDWQQPNDFIHRLRRAQQPPSTTAPVFVPPPVVLPTTEPLLVQFWRRQTQYPAIQAPTYVPAEVVNEATTEQDAIQFWRRQTQYPAVQGPVATLPGQFFDAPQHIVRPPVRAQQPPSFTEPVHVPPEVLGQPAQQMAQRRAVQQSVVTEPLLVRAPDWFETVQQQVFPRRWAQQPDSLTQPVALFVSPDAAPDFFDAPQQQVFPPVRAQQPPASSEPVLVPPFVPPEPPEPGGGGHPVTVRRPQRPQPELRITLPAEGHLRAIVRMQARPSLVVRGSGDLRATLGAPARPSFVLRARTDLRAVVDAQGSGERVRLHVVWNVRPSVAYAGRAALRGIITLEATPDHVDAGPDLLGLDLGLLG